MTETIVAYDAAARTLTYQATRIPAFVTLARNTWKVTPIGDDASHVGYEGRFETRGILGRLARRLILTQINRSAHHLLDDLKHYIEQGTPSPRKQRQLHRTSRIRRGSRQSASGG